MMRPSGCCTLISNCDTIICIFIKLTCWSLFAGNPPLVIARGGFSGLFPDSSYAAYSLALLTSVPDVILWCDVQLTKDRAGICFPDLKLNNASDISNIFQNRDKTYNVNGLPTQGWFSVDFTLKDLANVVCKFNIFIKFHFVSQAEWGS